MCRGQHHRDGLIAGLHQPEHLAGAPSGIRKSRASFRDGRSGPGPTLVAEKLLVARWTQPPAELRRRVQTRFAGKRQLAAATVTVPHRRPIRGSFGGRRRIFHFRTRSVPASSERDQRRQVRELWHPTCSWCSFRTKAPAVVDGKRCVEYELTLVP